MKIFGPGSLSLALSLGSLETQAVDIIAHRGASHDAPENTLAAVKLGWQQGADAVEIDIHSTKDGQIVAIHDDNTRRAAGVDKKVAAQTLAELRTLDAGRWKGKQWAGEKIPTLDEVLAAIPVGKRLVIEVKGGLEDVPSLAKAFKQSGRKPDEIVIIGFSFEAMKTAREELPETQVYWLASFDGKKQGIGEAPTLEELIRKAVAARFDGLNLSYKWPINAPFVKKVKGAGLKLCVWTVDDPALAKELAAAGVDGITTNRPGWLREKLETVR
jgi:glycerophosphoryl diester phosphodiesterase